MHTLYLASVWLHVIAAMSWVGGMIFLVAVIVPMLRRPDWRDRAREIMQVSGRRFRTLSWIAYGTLVVTGTFNIAYRGYGLDALMSGDLFRGVWGRTLAHKLGLVVFIMAFSAVHDFWLGPKAGDPDLSAEEREKWRKLASVMGRVTFAFALAIVALAINLVR